MSNAPLYIPSFAGGLNLIAQDGNRKENELSSLTGAVLDEYGNLVHPGAITTFLATTDPVVSTLRVFTQTGIPHFLYLTQTGTTYTLYDRNENTLVTTTVGAWPVNAYSTEAPSNHSNRLLQAGDFIIIQTQEIRLYRIGGSLITAGYTSLGTTQDGERLGTAAKVDSRTVQDAGAGFLQVDMTIPTTWYRYIVVEEDEYGNLTNPGDVSAAFNTNFTGTSGPDDSAPVNFVLSFTGIGPTSPSIGSGYVYGAPGKGKVRLFRFGGANNNFFFVSEFTPAILTVGGPVVEWSTASPYVDKVADLQAQAETPSFANVAAPLNTRCCEFHLNRLYVAGKGQGIEKQAQTLDCGNGSYLWFSRQGKVASWGYDDNGVDDDGGWYRLDGDPDDEIRQLLSFNGILIVGRKKSIYVLYGDRFENFRFDRRSTLGCVSRRSIARLDNRTFFFATDKTVREFGDSECPVVSSRIKPLLDAIPDTYLSTALLYCYDHRLYVTCQTGVATYLALWFDTRTNSWGGLDARWQGSSGSTQPKNGGGYELYLTGNVSGITRHDPTGSQSVSLDIKTDVLVFPATVRYGRLVNFALRGTLTPGTIVPGATLACGDTVTLDGGNGIDRFAFYNKRLPKSLTGTEAYARLTGDWMTGKLESIAMEVHTK